MGLVTRTKVIDAPDDDGSTLTVRGLSGKELDTAQRVSMQAAIELMDLLGGMDKIKEIQSGAGTTTRADVALDKDTVVEAGLVGWDGPSFCDDAGQPLPCNAENRALLDGATRDVAFAAIFDLSVRPTQDGNASV